MFGQTSRADQSVAALIGSKYRSDDEIAIREAVEAWGRPRYPGCRIIHELVVGRGEARADIVFVTETHIAAVEIKSAHDYGTRLMNQASLFRLAVPELWLVADHARHLKDFELIRYLIPTIGICEAVTDKTRDKPHRDKAIEIRCDAQQFVHHDWSMLQLLWVEELLFETGHAKVFQGKRANHNQLVTAMLMLSPEERLRAVCRQLRARNFMWRADPPILDPSVTWHGRPEQSETALPME